MKRRNYYNIELTAILVGTDGVMTKDGTFISFSMPTKAISTFIAMLTALTYEMVASAPPFFTVANDFFNFIGYDEAYCLSTTGKLISNHVFVARNDILL